MDLKMVVGLGNPGARYRRTRHNVGFMVADELLRRGRCGNDRTQNEAQVAPTLLGKQQVVVVQPQTFMNLSGHAVASVARRRGILPSEVLLVYDDADLSLGLVRIRPGGSAGGHRGVQSVLECLATQEIPRVRLGIGKDQGDLAGRVLRPFRKEEWPVVEDMITEAADAVEAVASEGVTAAMNRFNRRDVPS